MPEYGKAEIPKIIHPPPV